MKVLHTSPPMGPSYGGPYQSVRMLAGAEQAAGLEVAVRMPWSAEAEAHLAEWAPVEASAAGRVTVPPLGWSSEYARALRGEDADVLHSHGLWLHPSWGALDWKRRHGRPHVVSVRGMLEPWAWRHRAWKKRPVWWLWERRNLTSASLLHATSEAEAEAIRARSLHRPIAVIANGVYCPSSVVRGPLSGDPGAMHLDQGSRTDDKGVKTALFLSRVHPKKGLPMLLEAWAKLRPKGWRLRIVGPDEGGYEAELKRLAERLGFQSAFGGPLSVAGSVEADARPVVTFEGALHGEVKEAAYRDADLFILPTYSENFGIAVAEAMAHGLPVITTQGAPWKLLEEERCGWWTPVSVDGIAEALEDTCGRSSDELAAMGERGRAVAAARFSWDRIAAEMIACYRWVLGDGDKPECVV